MKRVLAFSVACVVGALGLSAGPATAQSRASFLPGIDVSHWQGTINWQQVKGAGIRFVFAKATEGDVPGGSGYFTDPKYKSYRTGAGNEKIRFGGYHYAQPDTSANDAVGEADFFASTAALKTGNLKPALDLEVSGGLGVTALQNWTQSWLDEVKKKVRAKPVIYTSRGFWQSYMGDTTKFADEGYTLLWIAHWTTANQPTLPASDWGGFGWAFWQFTSSGSVPGISGNVDRDWYNGTRLGKVTIH